MHRLVSTLRQHRRIVLTITVALAATACVLTHLPAGDVPDFQAGDTSLHTVGFFGLASWVILSLLAYRRRPLPRLLTVLAIMALYAALDEHTQPWFGRACEFRDWVNDMIGTVAAVALWELVFFLGLRKH